MKSSDVASAARLLLLQSPDDPALANKLGDILLRVGQLADALKIYWSLVERFSRNEDFNRAVSVCRKLERLLGPTPDVLMRIADMRARQGQTAEAVTLYENLAKHYVTENDAGSAALVLERAAEADPGSVRVHAGLADLYLGQRRIPEALSAYMTIARLLQERGDRNGAISVYEKAIGLMPTSVEALRPLVRLLIERGDGRRAAGFVGAALRANPQSLLLTILALETALKIGELGAAKGFVDRGRALNAEDDDIQRLTVDYYVATRDFDAASTAAGLLAQHWTALHGPERGIRFLEQLLRQTGDRLDLLWRLIALTIRAGDSTRVLRHATVFARLANREGDRVRAVEMLRRASRTERLDPSVSMALTDLAMSLEKASGAPARPGDTSQARMTEAPQPSDAPRLSTGLPVPAEDTATIRRERSTATPTAEDLVERFRLEIASDPALLAQVLEHIRAMPPGAGAESLQAVLAASGQRSGPQQSSDSSTRFEGYAESSFPAAVAVPFSEYLRDRSSARLATVLEEILRFVAVALVVECRETGVPVLDSEVLKVFLSSPPTAGRLYRISRQAAKAIGETGSSLATIVLDRDTAAELVGAVRARNRIVHEGGNPRSVDTFRRRVVGILKAFDEVLGRMLVLVPRTYSVEDGVRVMAAEIWKGAFRLPMSGRFHTGESLDCGRVFLVSGDEKRVFPAEPFLRIAKCPVCGAEHLFSWRGTDRGGVRYGAVGGDHLSGHSFQDKTVFDLVRDSLGGGWLGPRSTRPERFVWLDAVAESADMLPPGRRLGPNHEVVRLLDRGGMADVYEVTDCRTGERRAAKVLPYQISRDQRLLARMRREHHAIRRVENEHVIKVFEFGTDEGCSYLVTELASGWEVGGGTIRDLSRLPKPVRWERAMEIALPIAEALHAIHSRDLVHRDVKPSNVLLFRTRKLKLADFGMVKAEGDMTLTLTGLPIGTPEYMSPEQAQGGRSIGPRSDLYALGIVLFELLTGNVPFREATQMGTVFAQINKAAPSLSDLVPDLPLEVGQLVSWLLTKEPEGRPSSAFQVFSAIRAVLASRK